MNKKQNGFVDILAMFLIVALIAFSVYLIAQGLKHDDELNRWESDCRTSNGLIVKTSDNRLECYIDNKKVVLPGWEGY